MFSSTLFVYHHPTHPLPKSKKIILPEKCKYYWWHCWWTKSCTTWDGSNPMNNGIIIILGGARFLPATICFSTSWISRPSQADDVDFSDAPSAGLGTLTSVLSTVLQSASWELDPLFCWVSGLEGCWLWLLKVAHVDGWVQDDFKNLWFCHFPK